MVNYACCFEKDAQFMYVKDILKAKGSNVIAVDLLMTAQSVAKIFSNEKIGFAIVRDKSGKIVGTVTERDIVHNIAAKDAGSMSTPVKDFMTKKIVTCAPDDSLPRVMSLMTVRRTRHVLVMNGDEVAGVVSIGDAVKVRLEESMLDEASLRDYVSGMGYN